MRHKLEFVAHEDYLTLRAGAEVLEVDAHGEKMLRLPDGLMLKLFRRKRLISSAAWYPYACRFVDNANELRQRGIPVPSVIGGTLRIPSIERDAVLYQPLAGTALRVKIRGGIDAQTERALKSRLTRFVIHLHNLGIYFRSLHLGNIVETPNGELGLIDFADLRFYRRPLSMSMRRRNLQRMLGMPDEKNWIDSESILDPRAVVER